MAQEVMYTENEPGRGSRVRWGAVFAGVFIGIVTQVLLTLFGLAIGLSSLNPLQNADLSGFGVGSGVWMIVSMLISVFVGAWATSWWANIAYRPDGILHGILTWSLLLVLSVYMLGTGVGAILGGAFNVMTSALTGATQGVAMRPAAYTSPAMAGKVGNIQNKIGQVISPPGPASNKLANLNVPNAVKTQINQKIASGDTNGAAALIQQHTRMSQAQARDLVSSSQVETREVAQTVTDTAGKVFWWLFGAALLSLIAAAVGGLLGCRNRYIRTV